MCDLSAQGTNRVPNVANFALDAIVRSPGSLAQNGTTKRGMESIPWSLGPSIFVLDFSLCMSVTLPVVAMGSRSDSLNGVSTPIYIGPLPTGEPTSPRSVPPPIRVERDGNIPFFLLFLFLN